MSQNLGDTISISTARANLPKIVEDVAKYLRRFTITVNGQPQAVVLSREELESIEETAKILTIPGALEAIKKGTEQIKKGEYVSLEDLDIKD